MKRSICKKPNKQQTNNWPSGVSLFCHTAFIAASQSMIRRPRNKCGVTEARTINTASLLGRAGTIEGLQHRIGDRDGFAIRIIGTLGHDQIGKLRRLIHG